MSDNYDDYIYEVDGESIYKKPKKIFDDSGVFLIIDKKKELIWIWAGKDSRLFHRYIAAKWAGNLKYKKEFYNFKYEMVKQGKESRSFFKIINEIEMSNNGSIYAQQIKDFKEKNKISLISENNSLQLEKNKSNLFQSNHKLTNFERSQLKMMLVEIKEMQKHIKYTYKHIQKRINDIEKKLEM